VTKRAKRGDRRTRRRSRRPSAPAHPASVAASADKGLPTFAPLLLTQTQVLNALQVSRTGFWKLRGLPPSDPRRFPSPVRLGAFALRWRVVDVEKWIERQQVGAGAAA
jgi:predicted DNA-binding transcriptional regulator AlpA